jgi:outer membrane receptor protein involved in Fe transport
MAAASGCASDRVGPGAGHGPTFWKLDTLVANAGEAVSGGTASTVVLPADRATATIVNFGREQMVVVDPYTGAVRGHGASATRGFFRIVTDWHRWLGRHDDSRESGRAVTGACNAAFMVVVMSGFYLGWPRRWARLAVRTVTIPSLTLRGKPQSITVVPQELIQQQGVTNLRDALRNVTGISFQAGEGGGAQGDNLSLRGFNARNDFFLDGVRDQGSYFRDLFNIEGVEVLKGPSALYLGHGTTGGVINQVSKLPRLDSFYGGTLSFGNGFLSRTTGDINQRLNETTAFRMTFMGHLDEMVDRAEVEQKRMGIAPSVTFGLGMSTQLTVGYFLQHEDNIPDYGLPFLFGKPPEVSRENFYGLATEDTEDTWVNIGTLRLDHRFNDQLSLRDTLRYGRVDREAFPSPPRISGTPTPSTSLSEIIVAAGHPGRDTTDGSSPGDFRGCVGKTRSYRDFLWRA